MHYNCRYFHQSCVLVQIHLLGRSEQNPRETDKMIFEQLFIRERERVRVLRVSVQEMVREMKRKKLKDEN